MSQDNKPCRTCGHTEERWHPVLRWLTIGLFVVAAVGTLVNFFFFTKPQMDAERAARLVQVTVVPTAATHTAQPVSTVAPVVVVPTASVTLPTVQPTPSVEELLLEEACASLHITGTTSNLKSLWVPATFGSPKPEDEWGCRRREVFKTIKTADPSKIFIRMQVEKTFHKGILDWYTVEFNLIDEGSAPRVRVDIWGESTQVTYVRYWLISRAEVSDFVDNEARMWEGAFVNAHLYSDGFYWSGSLGRSLNLLEGKVLIANLEMRDGPGNGYAVVGKMAKNQKFFCLPPELQQSEHSNPGGFTYCHLFVRAERAPEGWYKATGRFIYVGPDSVIWKEPVK